MKLAIGDYFKIDHPQGSCGIVQHLPSHPLLRDSFYGTYYYGIDKAGEHMTTSTGLVKFNAIVKITKEAFEAVANSPGFGGKRE